MRASKNNRRRFKMKKSLKTSNENILELPDSLTQAATAILSTGLLRVTTQKGEITPPRNSIIKKEFVSPIDKLLKKNGSVLDTFNMINMNMFVQHDNTHSANQTYAQTNACVSLININQSKDNHSSDEEQAVNYVTPTALMKLPSNLNKNYTTESSIINEDIRNFYKVGELFWGQIYNYCYWPCMVCPDPDSKECAMETSGNMDTLRVHVRFFADKGRRSWIKRENLIPFVDLPCYLTHLEEAKKKFGLNSAKCKLFLPTKTQQHSWHLAIKEAYILVETPDVRRVQKFEQILEDSRTLLKLDRPINEPISIRKISNSSINDFNSTMVEGEQFMSPYSPIYSPIKNNAPKKRKISHDYNNIKEDKSAILLNNLTTDTCGINLQYHNIYYTIDFQIFYKIMKDFVFEQYEDDTLERNLLTTTRQLWIVRHLVSIQRDKLLMKNSTKLDSASVYNKGDSALKRLSTRLKAMLVRKQQQQQQYRDHQDAKINVEVVNKRLLNTSRKKKITNRPIEDVINDIFELDPRYLFKGLNREPVCKYCLKPDHNLKKCSKNCKNWVHANCLNGKFDCIDDNKFMTDSNLPIFNSHILSRKNNLEISHNENQENVNKDLICRECDSNESIVCSVCCKSESSKETDMFICTMPNCNRAFHLSCCKYWPQSKVVKINGQIQSFRCPCHVCHTCVSDDPKEKFHHLRNTKIVNCVKCPATYHCDSTCIPAGSEILTAACIICPRHISTKSDVNVNVNWCFICVKGGQLVCCETCPIAVHAQCLNININPHEGYICEECESGRMPLYGEMVWAKFNNFRWWPAIILPPPEVPQNILKMPHNKSDFVVRFFGSHDHGWISRRRVYLYVEGDCSEPPRTKSGLDVTYKRGIEEAKHIYEIIKSKKFQLRGLIANKKKLQPQPYVRIRSNRAVPPVKFQIDIQNVSKCECKANDEDPCGPTSNCLNRAVYHECNRKVCAAGERCQNQMFESRISPRLSVVYMEERGFGLVSQEFIPAGSFIIEYVGEVINYNEFKNRMAQKSNARDENFYFLSVEKDYIIDAGPKGNLARFMNHSCNPNCETQKWLVNSINRVGIFAIKDIPENTELTFNYLWDDMLGNEKKTCFCGSKNCSGQIGVKPKESTEDIKDISTKYSGLKSKSDLSAKIVKKPKKKRKRNLLNNNRNKSTARTIKDIKL